MSKLLCSMLTLVMMSIFTTSAYAETIRYNGAADILRGVMYKASFQFKELEGVEFDLKGATTAVGIEKLLAGECDIAGGGRPLSASEKALGLVQTPLLMDADAIIVHPSNPVDAITPTQLADILKGNATSWTGFSEFQSSVRIYAPPINSAHFKEFQHEFGFGKLPRSGVNVQNTSDVYYNVRSTSGAIGWLSHSLVSLKSDVKILGIKQEQNGEIVKINAENVRSGAYPYVGMEYFYTKGQPEGEVKKFIDFMKSPAGEKIIVEGGDFLVPSTPDPALGEAF